MTKENTFLLFLTIKEDKDKAMKAGDTFELGVLRRLIAEIELEMKKDGSNKISDAHTESIVSRQLKKLDKEMDAYKAVKRSTATQEQEQEILLSYLPKQLTEDEIRSEVTIAKQMVDEGKIKNPMQYLSKQLKGIADMTLVGKIVKETK